MGNIENNDLDKKAPPPVLDEQFLHDIDKKVSYKIAKKQRESREFLKAKEQKIDEKLPLNIENVSHETNNKWLNYIFGGILLGTALFCLLKVFKNVKKS